MAGSTQTSQRNLKAVERQLEALELRKAGKTYEFIAAKLGYRSRSSAYDAVKVALKRTLQEPADELRALEVARLDQMLEGLWDAATSGRWLAVDRVLSIMQRRAELLGLDAPKNVNLTVLVRQEAERIAEQLGLDPDEVLAEASEILKAART